VGTYIYERGDGQHTIDQIATELAEKYNVPPGEAARDCQEFIDSLVEQGLSQWSNAQGSP